MKPSKGSNYLRKGRASIKNQHYLLTTTVLDRKPFLKREHAAEIVLVSLHWLEKQGNIILDAAVVVPDHLHFAAGLKNGSLLIAVENRSHTIRRNFFPRSGSSNWMKFSKNLTLKNGRRLKPTIAHGCGSGLQPRVK